MTTAGNRPVRWMTTELAWSWVRYQPESALRGGLQERFGGGGKRLRRLGIVAVARQLLMARWRFLETGGFPEGAALQEVEAVCRCCVRRRSWGWWRRPVTLPGPCRSRRIEGVASERSSGSRRKTQRESG